MPRSIADAYRALPAEHAQAAEPRRLAAIQRLDAGLREEMAKLIDGSKGSGARWTVKAGTDVVEGDMWFFMADEGQQMVRRELGFEGEDPEINVNVWAGQTCLDGPRGREYRKRLTITLERASGDE
jgi:hypothetical protein